MKLSSKEFAQLLKSSSYSKQKKNEIVKQLKKGELNENELANLEESLIRESEAITEASSNFKNRLPKIIKLLMKIFNHNQLNGKAR